MNAPLRKVAFEPAFEQKLARPEHLRTSRARPGERVAGIVVTVLAHAGAVAALVLGFHAARPLIAPQSITVTVEEKKVKQEALDIVLPKFTPPPQMNVPVPLFAIAPSPHAITAPPRAEPAPPAPPSQGPRDNGEARGTYLGSLLAQLNRFKHYPPEAKSARIEGVVMLHFIVDRSGKVLSAEIAQSSGRPALDREAMALIRRAEPLPVMPAAMSGDTLDAIVPIKFSLH